MPAIDVLLGSLHTEEYCLSREQTAASKLGM